MKTITLTVSKEDVYNEVAKTTAYIGMKMQGDDDAYERIFTTEGDRDMLERMWVEACNTATDALKQFATSVSGHETSSTAKTDDDYVVTLGVSSRYDDTLTQGIEAGLANFFVAALVSKWCTLTDKGEAASYGTDAQALLSDVVGKIYHKRRPERS